MRLALSLEQPWNALTSIDSCRAATADIKLCVLPLDELFPTTASDTLTTSSPPPRIDPLTLSLIDGHTLVLLNKLDSTLPPSRAQLDALAAVLAREGKAWLGAREGEEDEGGGRAFWPVSVRDGTGLAELAEGIKRELKRRYVGPGLRSLLCVKRD